MRKIFVLLALLLCAGASGSETAEREALRIGDDVFVAGDEATFRGETSGDALLAGGEVGIEGTVGGDAVLAGGRISVRGNVNEDIYAAGGELSIAGRIGGSARLAGGEIEIGEDASIAEGISIAGGRVRFDGHAGRYVQIAGGEVRINGRMDGDVNVSGGELVIGPDAIIEGRLTYRGPQAARVSSNATIRGGVVNLPGRHGDGKFAGRIFSAFAVVWIAGWTLVGVLLLALLPRATRTVTETVRSRPGASTLLGLAVLCAIPIVIVLVAITLVGIPLALLLLFLYLVLLPLGYLASIATLGDWLLPSLRGAKPISNAMRIGAFVAVLVIVYFVTRVPVLGGLIAFILILAGMGGLVLSMVRRRQQGSPATT